MGLLLFATSPAGLQPDEWGQHAARGPAPVSAGTDTLSTARTLLTNPTFGERMTLSGHIRSLYAASPRQEKRGREIFRPSSHQVAIRNDLPPQTAVRVRRCRIQ